MAWRWLTRMRTALYLLGILALQTVLATVVPQAPNVSATVAAWRAGSEGPGPVVVGLIDAIGGFDVYGSPLFLAFLLLLFLSLTACLIPRIRAWVRLVRRSQPPLLRRPSPSDLVARFDTDRTADEVHARARELLGFRRWRVRSDDDTPAATEVARLEGPADRVTASESDPDEARRQLSQAPPAQVAGEKGLWSREGGSLAFHVSFYVLVAAIVFGQLLTFEGQRGVVEGELGFSDTAVSYWTYRPGRWFSEGDHAGWRLDLDDFHVDWIRDPTAPGAGQPTTFASDVTVTPADGEPFAARIEGNHPLVVDGMKIHQLDWGYALRVVVEVDGEVVHDGFVTSQLTDGRMYRTAVKAPAADPDVGLELYFWPYAPDGDDGEPVLTGAPWDEAPLLLLRQWRGDLQLGATQQVVTELDTTELASEGAALLRVGQHAQIGGVTVRFPEVRRWVGFQVSSRPQIPWLLLAGGLLVTGLTAALYAYRRRLWVLAVRDPDDRSTLVTVVGRAFQRPDRFEQEFRRLVESLEAATSATSSSAGSQRPPPQPGDALTSGEQPDARRLGAAPRLGKERA